VDGRGWLGDEQIAERELGVPINSSLAHAAELQDGGVTHHTEPFGTSLIQTRGRMEKGLLAWRVWAAACQQQ